MHYFFGGLLILILIMALPPMTFWAIAIFFIISALIVQTSASFVTKTKIPFSKSIKAVIYSLFFSLLAVFLVFQLVAVTAPPVIFLAPILMFIVQAMAYSIALEVTFVGSAIISICVMVVWWLTKIVFGLSMSTMFQLMS